MQRQKDIKDERLQDIVNKILAVADPDKIMLYGSRARNENGSRSDFDIAVFGKVNIDKIWDNLQEADTLLKIDLVAFDELTNEILKKKILAEGIILYERKI
ncbi:MAG: nucleotidyltransferase domain-containing protein [Candidatus Margulisbacteria bacterium]|nr:nucleotidyltransferase domain-containing protein [Candidatus Margulisiibacteriota bacterium]